MRFPTCRPNHFNPLSPHGERRSFSREGQGRVGISIHSPRMGRDGAGGVAQNNAFISIHSPRMGRDLICIAVHDGQDDFNPLSPHGERPVWLVYRLLYNGFQSTLPAWGETCTFARLYLLLIFQSTLPAWGETRGISPSAVSAGFQSTLPAWGETLTVLSYE